MRRFILICIAGAMGTGSRYLLATSVQRAMSTTIPYGTLLVNIIGSLLVGIVMTLSLHTQLISPNWRLILTAGFLGGFTTYSAYSYETAQLMLYGNFRVGVLNVVITTGTCLLACLGGVWAARWWIG